jgi:plasmid stabilization system protein ParE
LSAALKLRITARATAQIERADRWWAKNRPSARDAVLEDLAGALRILVQQPGMGVKVSNARLAGLRRLHLGRIRYFVYYRVKNGELVALAFWHASRDGGPSL